MQNCGNISMGMLHANIPRDRHTISKKGQRGVLNIRQQSCCCFHSALVSLGRSRGQINITWGQSPGVLTQKMSTRALGDLIVVVTPEVRGHMDVRGLREWESRLQGIFGLASKWRSGVIWTREDNVSGSPGYRGISGTSLFLENHDSIYLTKCERGQPNYYCFIYTCIWTYYWATECMLKLKESLVEYISKRL